MSKKYKKKEEIAPTNRVLAYARVSSKEQEKEGFSIAAQQKSLQAYAQENGFQIAHEFVDVETAKTAGRPAFSDMLKHLKRNTSVRILLVEKTDRLYRNLKDWVTLDDLDIEIHLVKEGIILSRDSRSSEKFVHGIKVLMAKNYIDNLSEEARKGQQEKADQGIWPTKAPLGYRNVLGPNGKRVIEPDPDSAPFISKMFAWYASGTLAMKDIATKLRGEGFCYRRTGASVPASAIHAILRNRLYTGDFIWKGQRYRGKHVPLITEELYDRVQQVIRARQAGKTRTVRHFFAFATLIRCGHCGCALVGEIKKRRYVYYHCTGNKQKCREPYVREEVLTEQFAAILRRLQFSDEVLDMVSRGLKESHDDEYREHADAVVRLKAEQSKFQGRRHAMYLDRLDGRIDTYFFDKLSNDLRHEEERVLREMERHMLADNSYLLDGVGILDVARKSLSLFESESEFEKRRLLNFVVSNSTWKNGTLTATFRQPFDLIAQTTAAVARASADHGQKLARHSGWLGD